VTGAHTPTTDMDWKHWRLVRTKRLELTGMVVHRMEWNHDKTGDTDYSVEMHPSYAVLSYEDLQRLSRFLA